MKRSEKIIYFLVLFVFGVMVAILVDRANYLGLFYCLLFFVFYFVFFISKISFYNFLLLLLAFLCGFLRFFINISDEEIFKFSDDTYEISGRICREPDFRADKIKYVLCHLKAKNHDFDGEVHGKLLLNAPIFPEFSYGDKISFFASSFQPFSSYEFSYEDYLYRYDIYYFVNSPTQISFTPSSTIIHSFKKFVFNIKKIFLSQVSFVYLEPHSSLVSGILLGDRKGFSSEINENFKNAGLMHIVAVSGYNISILIIFVFSMFSFLGRNVRIFLSIFIVFVFVLLSGLSASAIRAGIMGTISLLALFLGNSYQVKISLFLSAFIMIFFEPKIVYYDIGFQLSFLATMGLIYLSQPVSKFFSFLPEFFEIRNSIALTVSATLCVFPVMAISFGSLSIFAPISNLLVLPFLPVFMALSFISLLLSFFSSIFSLIPAFFAYLISSFVFFTAEIFGNIGFSLINLERLPSFFIFLFVCALVYEVKMYSLGVDGEV